MEFSIPATIQLDILLIELKLYIFNDINRNTITAIVLTKYIFNASFLL